MSHTSNGKKKFDKKVRWEFKIAVHGHGRTIKEALQSAVARLEDQVDREFSSHDFEMIEEHETVDIVEDDIEEDEDPVKTVCTCEKPTPAGARCLNCWELIK